MAAPYNIAVVHDSIRVLQAHGYKVTKARREVLEVLDRTQEPLSPYDIQRILGKRGKSLNHVTIYRILDLFCSLRLAHRVLSSGGFVKCSLGTCQGCHRLMLCRGCGGIIEFADEGLCRAESGLARDSGFHTEYHLSESLGLCSRCFGKAAEQHSVS